MLVARSIQEVKKRAEKNNPYFFSPSTMRFFKSRVSEECYELNDDIFFITSEKDKNEDPRRFTVRKCSKDGDIDTIGEFMEFSSLQQARNAIKKMFGDKWK